MSMSEPYVVMDDKGNYLIGKVDEISRWTRDLLHATIYPGELEVVNCKSVPLKIAILNELDLLNLRRHQLDEQASALNSFYIRLLCHA